MVELTYGGTWLKWSSLDRESRNLALLSFVTAMVAALPVAVVTGSWGFRIGYHLGSGGLDMPPGTFQSLFASDLFAYAMLASAILAVVSGIAWWLFSRRQDEMFNRIQNYAIAQATGWTFAITFLWWQLALGGWLPPLPLTAIVVIGCVLVTGFWFQAVRRWL